MKNSMDKFNRDDRVRNIITGFSFIIFILIYQMTSAQSPDTLWSRIYGGDLTEEGYCVSMITDGGYIVTGGTQSFGNGGLDAWLLKIDEYGDTVWTKTYGGSNTDLGQGVIQTSDGGYIIAGNTRSFGAGNYDVWVIKTNDVGDSVWARTYGGAGADYGHSISPTYDGGYVIFGNTGSYGAGSIDIWVLKLDENGDTAWTKTYGGNLSEYSSTGQQTSDSGYIVVGYTRSFSVDSTDIWLVKTDANGDTLWTRVFGGAHPDYGTSVVQTPDSGFILAGYYYYYFPNTWYTRLIKIDSMGDVQWRRHHEEVRVRDVKCASDGGYILIGDGATSNLVPPPTNIKLIKTDESGYINWMMTFGVPSISDYGRSVLQASDGGYVAAGTIYNNTNGSFDLWLLKTDSDQTGIKSASTLISPNIISLFQNYPNPFNNSTRICFSLSRSSFVNLAGYDLLGRKIITFANEVLPQGDHEFLWNGSDYASGMYFIKLTTDQEVILRRILLLR